MNKTYKKPEFSLFWCTSQDVLLSSITTDIWQSGNDFGANDPFNLGGGQ